MTVPDLRGERGFTLIELMVAALSGLVVAAAMGAIVVASVHLRSNLGDRVDANQQARTAMEKITQALNSSCVATAVAPIVGGTNSDDTHLVFYNSLTDVPTIQPNLVTVALTGGQLTMSTATWASGTAPSLSNPNPWTFNTGTATTVVLLQHAVAATVNSVAQPVFQYYGYASNGSISTTPFMATSTTPLSGISPWPSRG